MRPLCMPANKHTEASNHSTGGNMTEETEYQRLRRTQLEWEEAKREGRLPDANRSDGNLKKGWKWWQITLAVIGGMFVIGALMPKDTSTKTARVAGTPVSQDEINAGASGTRDRVNNALQVTAAELFNAYDSNEAAAQQRYGDRDLLVTGTVKSIDLDFMDKPNVLLETPNQFMSANASLTEESEGFAANLSKGQSVTLLCGDVSEAVGMPMLKKCEIQ